MSIRRYLRRSWTFSLIEGPLAMIASRHILKSWSNIDFLYFLRRLERQTPPRKIEDYGLHYFNLSFTHAEGGTTTWACAQVGWPDRKITLARIAEVKSGLEIDPRSVLVSCTYLGFMTPDEMRGDKT